MSLLIKLIYSLIRWIGNNVTYIFRKWVNYVFFRWNPLAWAVKYWSVSLAMELSLLASENRLQKLWKYIDVQIGEGWSLFFEISTEIILGTFNLGYSWLNIILKLFLVIFFGVLAARRDSNQPLLYIGEKCWKPNQKWFNKIHDKHFTADIQSKYQEELYEEQGVGEQLIKGLTVLEPNKEAALSKLSIIQVSLSQFRKKYQLMLKYLNSQNVTINKGSNQYTQLNQLFNDTIDLEATVKRQIKIVKQKQLNYFSLTQLLPSYLQEVRQFDIELLERYSKEDQFIDKIPESPLYIKEVFDDVVKLAKEITDWDEFKEGLRNNILIIHGDAGVGKSNLSAHVVSELYQRFIPVIFIKGSSFRGSPDAFETILKRELEISANISVLDILGKLNAHGKRKRKRVVLIFDALNETTFETSGFSQIWRKSLDDFIIQLKKHPYLFFIATLRTSYLNRIWTEVPPYRYYQLKGFNTENLSEVIRKYFKHYRISYDRLDNINTFYFRNPLMLDLYCKMLNPKREKDVPAQLGYDGFQTVFKHYIDKLKHDTKNDLGLTSENLVTKGLRRCSDAMLNTIEAMIPIEDYYNLMEGSTVRSVNGTIGGSVLNGYLIYIEDSISDQNVVVHAQQLVGGYLLANRLLETHGGIQGVMNSDYFNDYIIVENGGHQLKDDILQFLTTASINYVPYVTKYKNNDRIRKFLLLKLQREPETESSGKLRATLLASCSTNADYKEIIDASTEFLTVPESPLRISRFSDVIVKLNNFDFDFVWTQYVYQNATYFFKQIDKFIKDIEGFKGGEEIEETILLNFELSILLLETTVQDLRDLATKALIEFGNLFPDHLFRSLYKYSELERSYSYERLALICYGISLRRQNDPEFIEKVLTLNAPKIYKLQFVSKAIHSTYNYIVIDSFVHLINLAIHKAVFDLPITQRDKLKRYQFTPPYAWHNASETEVEKVRDITASPYSSHGPDPLRMDFVNYTIGRLIISNPHDQTFERKLLAVANIYRRILDLGYQTPALDERREDSKFFYGERSYAVPGKVERLGKKYSWIAYFDYAGLLLKKGELNAWYPEEKGSDGIYQRLSDVRIEASNTLPLKHQTRLYYYQMLADRIKGKDWVSKTLYDTTEELWRRKFDTEEFILINGSVQETVTNSYDIRTYMLIDVFCVKKEDIEGNKHLITNREFDWNDDISYNDSLTGVYFGELYWADNVATNLAWTESLALEEEDIEMSFEVEPATVGYLWESGSDIFPTLSQNIPSPNIGKHLSLSADTESFSFLDGNGKPASKYLTFKNETINQNFTYLRADLLKKYLNDHGLILMYQIKQHSYDRPADSSGSQFRGMQFFFPE